MHAFDTFFLYLSNRYVYILGGGGREGAVEKKNEQQMRREDLRLTLESYNTGRGEYDGNFKSYRQTLWLQ